MSAYRELPPPRPWRILYRPPLPQRIGDGAFFIGSGAVTLLGLAASAILFTMGDAAFVVGIFVVMAAATSGILFCIAWMTRLSEVAERAVSMVIPGAPGCCKIVSEGECWALPIAAEAVQIGQTIRVRYRDVTPGSSSAGWREIIEIHVAED